MTPKHKPATTNSITDSKRSCPLPLNNTATVAVAVTPDIQQEEKEDEAHVVVLTDGSTSSEDPMILATNIRETTATSTICGCNNSQQQPKQLTAAQQSMVIAHNIKNRQICSPEAAMQLLQAQQPSSRSSLDWEEAWYETLQLCGKAKNTPLAVHIAQDCIPASSERCRALAISICGRHQNMAGVLRLLTVPSSTPAPYHAAIAACGTNRAWQEALDIGYRQMPRAMVSIITCNAVLTALAKAQRGTEALHFVRTMPVSMGVEPDRTSYHKTLSALIGSQQLDAAIDLVWNTMNNNTHHHHNNVQPNQETCDRLISAIVGRVGRKSEAEESPEQRDHYQMTVQQLQRLQQQQQPLDRNNKKRKRPPDEFRALLGSKAIKRKDDNSSQVADADFDVKEDPQLAAKHTSASSSSFQKWLLPKVGKCKDAYWELGTVAIDTQLIVNDDNGDSSREISPAASKSHLVVGLHPNRNPAKNGIQLWFFREQTQPNNTTDDVCVDSSSHKHRQKLGYLLMINSPDNNCNSPESTHSTTTNNSGTSQFLGLKVMDKVRNQGLAKVFAAVWLQCCIDGNIQPVTGRMNKPLLCLILQHTFGFADCPGSGGAPARILPQSCLPSSMSVSSPQTVVLTPASLAVKNLAGVFAPRDLREQQIQLVPPSLVPTCSTKGRVIVVGGTLQAPESHVELQRSIDEVLQQRWRPSPEIGTGLRKAATISRLFLGV